jgi:hypothetical protein
LTALFHYTISGLHLQSEWELPELVPAPDAGQPAQVRLLRAETPSALENPSRRGVLYQASPSQFLLQMPNIASYWVRNGEEILVNPQPESREEEVRLFLLGTVWAALLHQREFLVLHASGVITLKGAVIFMGRSGGGKSSLAAAFYRRGYPALGDDTIAVDVLDGKTLAYPTFPQLRLWPDMLHALGVAPKETIALRPNLPKRGLPTAEGFCTKAQPIHAIYVLGSHIGEEIMLEKVPGMARFNTLRHNTFREKFLSGLGVRAVHFKKVTEVAQKTSVYQLTRPEKDGNLPDLVDVIVKDLGL